MFQNIQSITNKQHLLEAFFHEKPIYNAICLCETWLSQEKLENLHFSEYKIAASYCRRTRGGGGVSILLQDHIYFKEIYEIRDMSIEYCIEICAIELPKENILILIIYWNRREEDLFIRQLKQVMQYIIKKYKKFNVILGGDFNINILENNSKTSSFLDLMLEYKFKQLIKEPTRISQTTSTCLDLIFTNFSDKNNYATVEELGFSDHSATIFHMKIQNVIKKQTYWYTQKRFYNTRNVQKFKSELKKQNWAEIITINKNIEDNYNSFNNTMNTIKN